MSKSINIEVVSSANDSYAGTRICRMTGSTANFYVNNNPFGNCQVFSIGSFNNIISNVVSNYSLQRLEEIINSIKAVCGITKSLMTIDIHEQKYEQCKAHLNVVAHYPYLSTNGSKMVQCIINTRGR